MQILNNAAFEQSLVTELEPSFEMKRGRKRGMKQTMLRRVGRKAPKGKKVYGKSGKQLKGMYVRKTGSRC